VWCNGSAATPAACIPLAPGNARILAFHSHAPLALGQWDKAIRDLNASVALDPLFPGGYVLLGLNHRGAGHWSEAEAAFKRVLDIAPNYVLVHYLLQKRCSSKGRSKRRCKKSIWSPTRRCS
jgi:tetratricopeptide (TPR) repeat protein